jgi:hypothetical protein
MRLWSDGSVKGLERPRLNITIKTASYTITPDDFGKVFTTRGATAAVTFTLPAAVTVNKGNWVLFVNIADQNMIVAGSDENLVVFNDATADTIAFQTSSEKIGGGFLAVSDGTSWCVMPLASETQTVTVGSS